MDSPTPAPPTNNAPTPRTILGIFPWFQGMFTVILTASLYVLVLLWAVYSMYHNAPPTSIEYLQRQADQWQTALLGMMVGGSAGVGVGYAAGMAGVRNRGNGKSAEGE